MNLAIDIGNSRIKLAIFSNDKEVDNCIAEDKNQEKVLNFVKSFPSIKQCIISTVTDIPASLLNLLTALSIKPLTLSPHTKLPIVLDYETPETLGLDRIAAVAGAHHIFPTYNVLVIDAGTAVTYDVKTRNGVFIGGNISPGLNMRFIALNENTSRLPLLKMQENFEVIGKNTKDAIVSGVQNGIIYEVTNTIDQLEKSFPELKIILTGGDALFFDNKLKKTIFVVSNLVSIGLNTILNYNVSKA